jgi:hypothetical protein
MYRHVSGLLSLGEAPPHPTHTQCPPYQHERHSNDSWRQAQRTGNKAMHDVVCLPGCLLDFDREDGGAIFL